MMKLVKMNQFLRPKMLLVTFVLLVALGNNLKSQVAGNPVPDATGDSIEKITKSTSDFLDRFQNTFSLDEKDKDKPKLTVVEIVLICVAAFVVFMFLLCCIGFCLCECVKELICCICCCKCLRD